jgi:hypothetical protein
MSRSKKISAVLDLEIQEDVVHQEIPFLIELVVLDRERLQVLTVENNLQCAGIPRRNWDEGCLLFGDCHVHLLFSPPTDAQLPFYSEL